MAKKIFSKRTLALLMTLVMCFSMLQVTAYAAPNRYNDNWSYAYYLGQEYLGNAAGAPVKPDPVGYGFQGVITSLTFQDDAGKTWTFNWSAVDNGEWRITGSGVSKEQASAFPKITQNKLYIGYCGSAAYAFTLSDDSKAAGWTYVNDSSRHANWFYYIRFIREYTVNVFYQNETGATVYKGVRYDAQAPLVRSFHFLYPNGDIIDDSEHEDGEYTDPVTLLPEEYLSAEMQAQGYEIKYATDAKGRDVLSTGVTISLLGDNVLNVYCTLIPPKTETYTVVHQYYADGTLEGTHNGGSLEVPADSDFGKLVAGIQKRTTNDGKTYAYTNYSVDPAAKVITLRYDRSKPVYSYSLTYNANFGKNETKLDSESVSGTYEAAVNMTVDANSFTREHYTFLGWNTASDGSGKAYAAGQPLALTKENNTEVLYAQWAEHPKYDYSLTYNANFGKNETKADAENVSGTYETAVSMGVDANGFVRANHTFAGWNTASDGSGKAYAAGETLGLTKDHNTEVLYAQWIEHPKYAYSLTYNANFGENETKLDSENVSDTYKTALNIQVDANSFTREHYTFLGWNTASDGSGKAYTPGQAVKLTAQDNTEILYAQWAEHPKYDYSLTYNANFGANETKADAENVSGTYETAVNMGVDANGFVRANYTFLGWNTASDGSGKAYAPGQPLKLTAQDNTEILYAQWAEYPKYDYSLTYNANFGENETKADAENVSGTYATSLNMVVDANGFVREHYDFVGWNTASDGSGIDYEAGQLLALTKDSNTEVLYAQWAEHPKYDYTVIYNANYTVVPMTLADSENVTGTYAEDLTIGVDACTFQRRHHTFIGWAADPHGEVVYQPGDEIVFHKGGSQELFARWIEHNKYSYSVIYNGNGGALEGGQLAYGDAENVAETYETSHAVLVDANSFLREHYTFTGWNTESDGSGISYNSENEIHLDTRNSMVTLYAQWTINRYAYTVEYEVRVDDGEYVPFQGELPENAPTGGEAEYGTEPQLENIPETLTDEERTYAFTLIENVVVDEDENVITVYYTHITPPAPPVEPPVDPVEPPVDPVNPPVDPVNPPVDPVNPPVDPVNPPVDPVEPPVDPVNPPVDPVNPPVNPETPEVPETPVVEIPDEDVPLAPTGGDGLVEIPDEDVPLADVPQTSDPMLFYIGMAAASGLGLLALNRKKEENEEQA